jgi:hypothetical protein
MNNNLFLSQFLNELGAHPVDIAFRSIKENFHQMRHMHNFYFASQDSLRKVPLTFIFHTSDVNTGTFHGRKNGKRTNTHVLYIKNSALIEYFLNCFNLFQFFWFKIFNDLGIYPEKFSDSVSSAHKKQELTVRRNDRSIVSGG